MEFGRLPSIDHVDFRLPADAAANRQFFAAQPGSGPGVLLGLSGWSDKGFVGGLYPPGTKPGEFIARYGDVFPTNELNSTFYGVSAERIGRWAAAVPPHFRFCPKLPRGITHDRTLVDVGAEMERFVAALAHFDGKVGRVWGTLAPSFGPDRLDVLASFLGDWAARVPLALELRHPAWFADPDARDRVFGCFTEHDVTAILTDVAGRRDVLHMHLTAPDIMLRFVGNGLHPTDFARLAEWVPRLADWLDRGLARAFVFMHQQSDPQAVDLAREFARLFAARTGFELLPPPEPRATQGELF